MEYSVLAYTVLAGELGEGRPDLKKNRCVCPLLLTILKDRGRFIHSSELP